MAKVPQTNVVIPPYLKQEVQDLVESGHYASLSDAVRTGLQLIVEKAQYRIIFNEFKREQRRTGAIVLENPRDVQLFIETVVRKSGQLHELFQPNTRKWLYRKRKFKF